MDINAKEVRYYPKMSFEHISESSLKKSRHTGTRNKILQESQLFGKTLTNNVHSFYFVKQEKKEGKSINLLILFILIQSTLAKSVGGVNG